MVTSNLRQALTGMEFVMPEVLYASLEGISIDMPPSPLLVSSMPSANPLVIDPPPRSLNEAVIDEWSSKTVLFIKLAT